MLEVDYLREDLRREGVCRGMIRLPRCRKGGRKL